MSLPKTYGLFRLTRDSELRFSSEGKPILKMGLVASEKYSDRETQCFIDATVFGKPAEIINQYAGEKGTQIFLTGKLQTETWESDGQRRSKHSMIVEGFDFVSKPKSSEKGEYKMPEPVYEKKQMDESNLPDIDVDSLEIPF